jgi:hypothetical protein
MIRIWTRLPITRVRVGLSPAVVARCHSQVRALFSWALRRSSRLRSPRYQRTLPA